MLDPVDRVCTWSGQVSSEFVIKASTSLDWKRRRKSCAEESLVLQRPFDQAAQT